MSRFSGSSVWQSLLSCVAQLASVEKLYMNLSFLTVKGFLRKEVCIVVVCIHICLSCIKIMQVKHGIHNKFSTNYANNNSIEVL